MNRTIIFLLISMAFSAFSCKNDGNSLSKSGGSKHDSLPASEQATQGGASPYTVTEGVVHWSAKLSIGIPHNGTLRVSKGSLMVKNGNLVSGEATMDMNSITVSDLENPKKKASLEDELKGEEFFDAAKFPTGRFKFDEVMPSKDPHFNAVLHGDLTLKGKTHPVNIPAKLNIKDDALEATTVSFPINRIDWGITSRSGLIKAAKDNMIEDVIIITIDLKARKE